MELQSLVYLIFHLYIIFLALYSALAIFALVRFGQSRAVALGTTIIYLSILAIIYTQTLLTISRL